MSTETHDLHIVEVDEGLYDGVCSCGWEVYSRSNTSNVEEAWEFHCDDAFDRATSHE